MGKTAADHLLLPLSSVFTRTVSV